MGLTEVPANDMWRVLGPLFPPGTYDLIRKNCNCFSDCALFYLLGDRLETRFRAIEKMGKGGQRKFGLLSGLNMVGLRYEENPAAAGWKNDEVVEHLAMT